MRAHRVWSASCYPLARYEFVRMVGGGYFHSQAPVVGYRCDICRWEGTVAIGAALIPAHEQTHVDAWLAFHGYVLPYAMDVDERMVLVDAMMRWW